MTTIKMDRSTRNLLVAILGFCAVALTATFCSTGCSSDPGPDPDTDATVITTIDGGTMTADTGTVNTTDGQTATADTGNTDPCAAYVPYAGQTWTCTLNGGIPEATIVTLEEYNGTCAVGLMEGCQNPPLNQLSAGDLTCTTYASHTMRCWRN